MATGLLIIRLVIGLTLAAHGAQKLFGWFHSQGIRSTAKDLAGLGYRPPMLFAVLSGVSEAGGGLLLALGLLVPLAAAAIVGAMLSGSLAVHLKNGFWNSNHGFEYPFVLAAVSVGLAFTGAGAWSLDAVLGLSSFGGAIWGSLAIVVGVVAALAIELYRRRGLAARQPVEDVSQPTRRAA